MTLRMVVRVCREPRFNSTRLYILAGLPLFFWFLVTRTIPLPSLAGSTPSVLFCTSPLQRNELRHFRLLGSLL